MRGERTTSVAINPKSVHRNKLFGVLDECHVWQDGMFSQVFRQLSRTANVRHQLLVLDGDVDTDWVESINTVMDDNKTLTLASNERIPLTETMRMLFEVASMRHAGPATVSRGGVVFMSEHDTGWRCYVASWVDSRETDHEKNELTKLFDKYVPKCLEFVAANCTQVIPLPPINVVQTLCYILEALLAHSEGGSQGLSVRSGPGELYGRAVEGKFIYSCVWGLAGAVPNTGKLAYSDIFDRFFKDTFNEFSFGTEGGSVFDHFFETTTLEFLHWKTELSPHTSVPDQPFANIFVATVESLRHSHLTSLLVGQRSV